MENPEGAAKKATTNRTGGYELNLTTAGIWKFQATKAGYLPNSASILVIEGYVYTVVGSFLILLVFAILVFLYLKKQRSLIVADEESLKRLTIEGRLKEYRRL